MSKIVLSTRPWASRGHADHGWLKTFHTFSFASYYDRSNMAFSNLRVINEDRVAAGTGFPTHPHSNAEIFSYIISGKLTHKDSMGNVETLDRSSVQFTSAGTGIRHSEYNDGKKDDVHFLQIWYTCPAGLPPKYYTSQTPETSKRDKLFTLIRPHTTFSKEELAITGLLPPDRPIPAHSSLVTRASVLSPGKTVENIIGAETDAKEGDERWLYVHLAQTSGYKDPKHAASAAIDGEANLKVSVKGSADAKQSVTLVEGDGVFIKGGRFGEVLTLESTGPSDAEFLVFDVLAD